MSWKDEFLQLMFDGGGKDDLNKAMELKREHIPKKLYKYRYFDDNSYAIKNLVDETMWMTTASCYNDPFDCALTFDFIEIMKNRMIDHEMFGYIEEGRKCKLKNMGLQEAMDQLYDQIASKYKKGGLTDADKEAIVYAICKELNESSDREIDNFNQMMQSGIFIHALSELNDSILMWSHYGKDHTGFCIEHNTLADKDENRTRLLFPVIYQDNMPDISPYLIKKERHAQCNIAVLAAMIKAKCWEYEHEWRYIFPEGPGKSFNVMSLPISAIYLGCKISDENQEILLDIARKKGIKAYKMKMRSNEFKLDAEELL